ncbi:hypothetical protein [Stenotrophomonas sp. PS02298]|uniref:hypothetical protein n=1 Tax=Stenotrophomonas sp. PS02298 TaxID=2991424 RepID=UPI00249BE726|nr:hypothetical protein [Stenotrophomonas sp. PS02298]
MSPYCQKQPFVAGTQGDSWSSFDLEELLRLARIGVCDKLLKLIFAMNPDFLEKKNHVLDRRRTQNKVRLISG